MIYKFGLLILASWVSAFPTIYSPGPIEHQGMIAEKGNSKLEWSSIKRRSSNTDVGYSFAFGPAGNIMAVGGTKAPLGVVYSLSTGQDEWESITTGSKWISTLSVINFTDPGNGWIVGERTVLHSTDEGKTWVRIHLPDSSKMTRLQAVASRTSDSVFLGGTTGHHDRTTSEPVHGVEILCADNSGKKVRICYKSGESNTINQIVTTKQGSTFALMDSRQMLVTRNSGANWERKSLPAIVSGLAVDASGKLWAIAVDGGIYCTQDNGDTWSELRLSGSQSDGIEWHSIAFSDSGFGIAVGDRGFIAINSGTGIWKVDRLRNTDEDLHEVQIHGTKAVVLGEINILISNLPEKSIGQTE